MCIASKSEYSQYSYWHLYSSSINSPGRSNTSSPIPSSDSTQSAFTRPTRHRIQAPTFRAKLLYSLRDARLECI